MAEFTRINIFPKDYQVLLVRFSEGVSRPKQGVLVHRALQLIEELEKEIATLKRSSK